jgi:glycosyltransferase involved in cell wall biosynthesis
MKHLQNSAPTGGREVVPGKPAVLVVGNFLSQHMTVRHVCEDLALQLRGAGWQVVTASDRPAPLARALDMLKTAWRRRRDYAVAQVNAYAFRAFLWAEAVCRLLRLLGKPYIITLHSGSFPDFARRRPDRLRSLLRHAAAVTVPSGFLQEKLAACREGLILLPNPVYLERSRYRARENPRPALMWLRSFDFRYQPALAVRVAARLVADFPDLTLTMVGMDRGDGSREEVMRLAAASGLETRLTLPGGVPKEQVPDWLERGDIFLNTTTVDNTPVSVMEAMASGLCVVSTDVGGLPYLLRHEEDALLVPPGDEEAMTRAVRRLLTEPGLAGRLSRRAREKAESFAWPVVLARWEALLAGVAEGRRW